jgi:hypothetical protein
MATQSKLNEMVFDLLTKYKSAQAQLLPKLGMSDELKQARFENLGLYCETFMMKFEQALAAHDTAVRRHAKDVKDEQSS